MNEYPSFISREVWKSAYYFFDLEPEPAAAFQVVCGGWESCLPHYQIERSDFPYFSLEYIVRGRGSVVLEGREYGLVPGTMFHYGPGITHEIVTDPAAPLEKYFVDFVGETAGAMLAQMPFSLLEPMYLASSDSTTKLFEELQSRGSARSVWTERHCSVLAELLLIRLAESAAPVRLRGSAARASYERCLRYIEEHCLTLRTLDEVCRGCHLDKPYVCRLFRRFGRETPYGMLQRMKMDRAAELLLSSNLMIKEVAAAVGFEDPYHFSHVFKRVRGVSPTDFVALARHQSL